MRRIVSAGARLLISAGVMAVLLTRMDLSALRAAFAQVRPAHVLAAVAVYTAAQLVSSLRWHVLGRSLGFGAPWRFLAATYFAGMFCNLFLPTSMGGDVLKAWRVWHREKKGWMSLVSVLADRGFGLLALIWIGGTAVWLVPAAATVPGLRSLFAALGAGALCAVMLAPQLAVPLERVRHIRGLAEGTRMIYRRPLTPLLVVALSLLIQGAGVAIVILYARMLGMELSVPLAAMAFSAATVLTLLPVSLNGIGVREAGYAALLGIGGVAPEQAFTLSLLVFFTQSAVSLAGAVPFVLDGGMERAPESESESESELES